MTARTFNLTEMHQRIDARLRDEQRKRFPDGLKMLELKKMKLRAKDLLHRLSRRKG